MNQQYEFEGSARLNNLNICTWHRSATEILKEIGKPFWLPPLGHNFFLIYDSLAIFDIQKLSGWLNKNLNLKFENLRSKRFSEKWFFLRWSLQFDNLFIFRSNWVINTSLKKKIEMYRKEAQEFKVFLRRIQFIRVNRIRQSKYWTLTYCSGMEQKWVLFISKDDLRVLQFLLPKTCIFMCTENIYI